MHEKPSTNERRHASQYKRTKPRESHPQARERATSSRTYFPRALPFETREHVRMNNISHPIQDQGSNRVLAPTILRYVPKNMDRLIGPFAGSVAISIAAAAHTLAQRHVINDVNKPLAEVRRVVVEQPTELAAFHEAPWEEQHSDSVEYCYQVRGRFNRTQDAHVILGGRAQKGEQLR